MEHEIIKWKVLEGVEFDLFGNHVSLAGTVHAKTLIMLWVVMIVMMTFAFLGTRKLTSGKPGKFQNVMEWVVDFIKKLVADNMDYKKAAGLLSYLLTLIMFIFFANMIGLIPNILAPLFNKIHFAGINEMFGYVDGHHVPLQSPTADINVTIALALLTLILVVSMGIKHKKGGFFKQFLNPLHIIDYIAKPMTLAFRLFGNIFAGETLIIVILTMLPGATVLVGIVPMVAWVGFSIFVGGIQSFVFTVLTIAYVAQAVSADH